MKNLIIQAVAWQSLETNIHIMVIIKSEQPPLFCPACNLNRSLAIFGSFCREKAMSYIWVTIKSVWWATFLFLNQNLNMKNIYFKYFIGFLQPPSAAKGSATAPLSVLGPAKHACPHAIGRLTWRGDSFTRASPKTFQPSSEGMSFLFFLAFQSLCSFAQPLLPSPAGRQHLMNAAELLPH